MTLREEKDRLILIRTIEAIMAHESVSLAALSLGCSRQTVYKIIKKANLYEGKRLRIHTLAHRLKMLHVENNST